MPHFLGGLHTPLTHVVLAGQHVRPHALATGQQVVPVHFCTPARQHSCTPEQETPQRQIGTDAVCRGEMLFGQSACQTLCALQSALESVGGPRQASNG